LRLILGFLADLLPIPPGDFGGNPIFMLILDFN